MSSRFERAYRVTGDTQLDEVFWNRIMRDLDTRIVAIEEKKADFEEAEKTLLDLGLRRINETLLPAAERIFRVGELGFLIASSDEEVTLVQGQNASLTIREGDQRDLFTPSPFIALTRRSTTDDYAIARTIAYDPETGVLLFEVETVVGNGGPHSDWDVAALAGSVAAMVAALDETRSLRQGVADDKEAVALMKAGAESARDIAVGAKNDAVLAKTGAENALTSFLTVYRGAHEGAPPNGEQGHFYFDTTLQQARVYTAAGWAPLFSVSLGGIRQDTIEAEEAQTVFTVDGGGFTFISVYKNGVLLVPGVDYTTASPSFTLATGAEEGDLISYTAYFATEQTDFYTKEAADARFFARSAFMNASLLADSGRFGGIEPKTQQVSSFVFPPYIGLYNDTTAASAGKFITNNTDYGGAAGNLSATVKDLIDKIKAPAQRRYGVEFFVAELTKGAGTASSAVNVGGTLYYVSSYFQFGPQVPKQTFHMYLRAIDAPILMDRAPGMTIIKEGVAYEENVMVDPSDGWVSVTIHFAFNPYEHIGYQPSVFQIRAAQSGHRYQIACPALIPGIVDIDDNIGVVAGINRYLYGLLSSTGGNQSIDGKLTVGAGPTADMDVATKQYVDGLDAATRLYVDARGPQDIAPGAVGSIAMVCEYGGTNHVVGDTVAGSALSLWECYSSSNMTDGGAGTIAMQSADGFLTGTWRWLTTSKRSGSATRLGIAVRIA